MYIIKFKNKIKFQIKDNNWRKINFASIPPVPDIQIPVHTKKCGKEQGQSVNKVGGAKNFHHLSKTEKGKKNDVHIIIFEKK